MIAKTELTDAWNFHIHEALLWPSGKLGVVITPEPSTEISMLLLLGEHTETEKNCRQRWHSV